MLRAYRISEDLEKDALDNTPAPTKRAISIATYLKVFREVTQWFHGL